MTEISAEFLTDQLKSAFDRARSISARLTEDNVSEPSVLPGWSRGHVAAHLTQFLEAMQRQLDFAARGETIEVYDGGMDGRNQRIELAARHSAEQHRADLTAVIDSLEASLTSLTPEGWAARVAYRDGTVLDAGLAIWRETTIHGTDLSLGFGPETWSRTFCEHLFDFLAPRIPEGLRVVLQPLGLPRVVIGAGDNGVVINGMITDIAAWLAGREATLGSLRATAAADGVDLPELLPWPSAPAPK